MSYEKYTKEFKLKLVREHLLEVFPKFCVNL